MRVQKLPLTDATTSMCISDFDDAYASYMCTTNETESFICGRRVTNMLALTIDHPFNIEVYSKDDKVRLLVEGIEFVVSKVIREGRALRSTGFGR